MLPKAVRSTEFSRSLWTSHIYLGRSLHLPTLESIGRKLAHVFKADLSGLKKEEVKVEVEEDRVLQISGERNVEKEDKNDKWHRMERSSGKFMRRFRFPKNAKMYHVKASMENGVLTVTVLKEQVKKPDVKSIEISG
ncbi:hypothetical protein RDI58_016703 [Solanum bulbocastanum]|uniref:SHSP domain-containing protein n=1 Tax=Solanum bulbocastanum TaxID=147425 RepID=A0AAN8TGP6_SOLBU